MNRRVLKENAKKSLHQHYLFFVIICIFATFLGTSFNNSFDFLKLENSSVESTSASTGATVSQKKQLQIIDDLLHGKKGDAEKIASDTEKTEEQSGTSVLGRRRGVLASLINTITSGAGIVTMVSAVSNLIGSVNVATILLILTATLVFLAFWFFVGNVFSVIMARIFLEGQTYEKVSLQRFLFLVRVKKWCKASLTMFLKWLFLSLWTFTIVGGIIKAYSYKMVRYIVAENPDIAPLEAITLSRRIMNGHKWECFVFDLSFIWWYVLNYITIGIAGILYVNPYYTSAYAQYYMYLRGLAKSQNVLGSELLNDRYLYEHASKKVAEEAYSDILVLQKELNTKPETRKGILGCIANLFGVVPYVDQTEKEMESYQEKRIKLRTYKDAVEGKLYPARLFTIQEKERRNRVESIHYLRHYSISSIVLMFFIFSFVGWVWEVSLHLISDGEFVNRGTMHGPWLPIYGMGGTFILLLLYKLRKYPIAEFISAIVLCGCVEYYSAYSLEMAHNGMKWWDYSGYFLNLDGRICAEGLLVFGLGGIAIVYVLAPMLDNFIRKIRFNILIPLCLVLVIAFSIDHVYSGKYPNMGKGITDYTQSE